MPKYIKIADLLLSINFIISKNSQSYDGMLYDLQSSITYIKPLFTLIFRRRLKVFLRMILDKKKIEKGLAIESYM